MLCSFSNFHKKWCLEKTQYFFQLEYSQWFRYNPERSVLNFQEYLKVVKNPVCLTMVTERLKHNMYRYVHEWDADMMRIWDNAIIFNEEGSQPYVIAKYLKKKYEKMCHPIPHSAYENDVRETLKQVEKVSALLSSDKMPFKKLNWTVGTISELQEKKELWKPLDFQEKEVTEDLKQALAKLLTKLKH